MDYYSELYEKLSGISTQYNFEKIKILFSIIMLNTEGKTKDKRSSVA